MYLRRFRSFQRGTVGLTRWTGCKVTSCQSWRMILSSKNWTRAALVYFELGRGKNILSNLQLWQLATLQPVDLQRPTVPLWKDLNPLNKLISIKRTERIFNTSYAQSKWPHLHRAYVIGVCIFFAMAVSVQLSSYENAAWPVYEEKWAFFKVEWCSAKVLQGQCLLEGTRPLLRPFNWGTIRCFISRGIKTARGWSKKFPKTPLLLSKVHKSKL